MDPLAAVRAAAKTATFVVKVLPMLPSRPIDWLTDEPVVERVRYPTGTGTVEGDLYRPSRPGRRPGIVVCLGVVPFGVDHPQVPVLGRALARAGFAALLYWSPAMRDFRLDPEDIEGIALAYRWLVDRPDVDPGRSGLLGTCVGGSFALMAAAHPLVRDRVGFVAEWAAYSSAWTLIRDVASSTRSSDDEGSRPWQVDPLTRKVFLHSLTAGLGQAEAERLRQVFGGATDQPDLSGLSEDGRAVVTLLRSRNASAAEVAMERLPGRLRARLDALSPSRYVSELRAPVIVVAHDEDDVVIPIGESRRLWKTLSARRGAHYTEFTMFQHMDPAKKRVSAAVFVRELAKVYLLLYPVFRRAAAA